jgi:hypothetical protein
VADLAHAPLLVDWRLMLTWAGVGLVGFVAGHPLRGSRYIATSPLWVLDSALRWAAPCPASTASACPPVAPSRAARPMRAEMHNHDDRHHGVSHHAAGGVA